MKKLFLIALLFMSVSSSVFYSCTDNIVDEVEVTESAYNGPKTTADLKVLLAESIHPVLLALSKSTKESLVKSAIFHDDRMRGFVNPDENIVNLKNTNVLEVLSVILQREVIVGVGNNSNELNSATLRRGPEPIASFCTNCFWYRDSHGCCNSGGDGCIDY